MPNQNEVPLVVRFTNLPGEVITRYDPTQRLLLVDKSRYDDLSEMQQRLVLRLDVYQSEHMEGTVAHTF